MTDLQENRLETLVFGFHVRDSGEVLSLNADIFDASGFTMPDGRLWLHVNRYSEIAKAWLSQELAPDPIVIGHLFQDETRPRAVRHGEGLLINVRGVNLNPGSEPEDLISLRMWVTEKLLITARAHPVRALDDMRVRFEEGDQPKSHGSLITDLTVRLLERMEPIVGKIEDQIDALEDDLLDESTPPPKRKIAGFRRSVLGLRRYIAPQREAYSALIREADFLLDDRDRMRLREAHDTITRLAEDLDLIRERALVMQEQITELRAEEMNQRLFFLAILSAVFLPLGFFTGLFGVNVGGMPGIDSPFAFASLCAGLVLLTGGLLLLFKRLKWL